MKKNLTFICLFCIFSLYTLNIDAKLRYPKSWDPSESLAPLDPYLYYESEMLNRNAPITKNSKHSLFLLTNEDAQLLQSESILDRYKAEDILVSDTLVVLKAMSELHTYTVATSGLVGIISAEAHLKLIDFRFEEKNQLFMDCNDLDFKLYNFAKQMHYFDKFGHLIGTWDRRQYNEAVLALIEAEDWTQSKVSDTILKHIETQQNIIYQFKSLYDPIIFSICQKAVGSSDCARKE